MTGLLLGVILAANTTTTTLLLGLDVAGFPAHECNRGSVVVDVTECVPAPPCVPPMRRRDVARYEWDDTTCRGAAAPCVPTVTKMLMSDWPECGGTVEH